MRSGVWRQPSVREEMGHVVSMTGVKRTLKLNSGAVPKIESRNMFTDIS